MSRTSGFTLLEILAVIALIALLATAAPFMNHSLLDRIRLIFAIRSVTARIYMAEVQAKAKNIPIRLTKPGLQHGIVVAVRFKDGADSHCAQCLVLYPDGSATPATLSLDAGRLTRTLIVNALDGRVDAGS